MMNWREILRMDLRVLLRGGRAYAFWASWRGPARKLQRLRDATRQLRAVVHAGVDHVGGLEALAADAPDREVGHLYRALAQDIASGLTFAQAMRKRPRFFPRYYCDLVEAGENTGALEQTLAELDEYLERNGLVRREIQGFWTYPLAVLTIQACIVTFLLVKVVPVFTEIFKEFGWLSMPKMALLNAMSTFAQAHWPHLLAIAACVVVGYVLVWRLIRARGLFDELLGRFVAAVPMLRALVVKRHLAHVARVLDKLLAASVPVPEALDDAAASDVNPMYARLLRRLKRRTEQGETLQTAMEPESRALLPLSFRGIVSVGESSGLLPQALGRIAGFYEREARKTLRMLGGLLEPLSIGLLAGVTLLITSAVFEALVGIMTVLMDEM